MRLRELWDSQALTLGGWCESGSPYLAELIARVGFDWVCIDTQHGLVSFEGLVSSLQAVEAAGAPTVVRVRSNNAAEIGQVLDAGAQGVIVPMINTREAAELAVRACRYAPDGDRSWGAGRGAALGLERYTAKAANVAVVCVVMVETIDAIARVDEIARVPGIDAIFVGPNDLAVGMGLDPSDAPSSREHDALIRRVQAACSAAGITAGIYCNGLDAAERWRDAGFTMLATPSDVDLMVEGALDLLARFRANTPVDNSDRLEAFASTKEVKPWGS